MYRLSSFAIFMFLIATLGYLQYPLERSQGEWLSLWALSLTATGVAALCAVSVIDIYLREESRRSEANKRKIDFTVQMYSRFQSREMVESRNVAQAIYEKYPIGAGLSFISLGSLMYQDEKSKDEWVSFSSLIHFYSNGGQLAKLELIEPDISRGLFEHYFDYHFNTGFMRELIGLTRDSGEAAYWLENIDFLQSFWGKIDGCLR
jgi:hypothetical protein